MNASMEFIYHISWKMLIICNIVTKIFIFLKQNQIVNHSSYVIVFYLC